MLHQREDPSSEIIVRIQSRPPRPAPSRRLSRSLPRPFFALLGRARHSAPQMRKIGRAEMPHAGGGRGEMARLFRAGSVVFASVGGSSSGDRWLERSRGEREGREEQGRTYELCRELLLDFVEVTAGPT